MFLDVHGFRAIIKSSPTLRSVSIHNCELLHFGATKELIEVVRCENEDRNAHQIQELEFDFYPRYYQGPLRGSLGCYGVVWSDEGFLDTTRAVVAALLTVIPLARSAGIDLLRPGKSFRLWLDKLPFKHRTLPYILDAILRIDDFLHGSSRAMAPTTRDTLLMTLWADIIIMMNGVSMSEATLVKIQTPKDLSSNWLLTCCVCLAPLPSIFFRSDIAARDSDTRICHGCQLFAYLNGEGHNYNSLHMKRHAASTLWDHGKIETVQQLFDPNGELYENGEPRFVVEARLASDAIARRRAYGIPRELVQAQEEFDELKKQDRTRAFGSNEITKLLDQAETRIQAIKAELGVAQIAPGTEAQPRAPAATSWQDNIRWYMSTVDEERGRLKVVGPYAGVVTKASAVKSAFW